MTRARLSRLQVPVAGSLAWLLGCAPDTATAYSEGETGAGDETGTEDSPAYDIKTTDATNCVQASTSSLTDFQITENGQIANISLIPGRVLCPIIRDRPNSAKPWEARMAAIDLNVDDDIACTAIARDLDGTVVAQSATKTTSGTGVQTLQLAVPSTEPYAYHYVECVVPGADSASGQPSMLASLVSLEEKTLELSNGKSHPGILAQYINLELLGPTPVIDAGGLAEVYIPEGEGLSLVYLPLLRDNPDENPERVRIHYYKDAEDAGFICTFSTHSDSGVMFDLFAGDLSFGGPFGTIEIPIPAAPISNGPHAVICLAAGPAAILAYDLDEP